MWHLNSTPNHLQNRISHSLEISPNYDFIRKVKLPISTLHNKAELWHSSLFPPLLDSIPRAEQFVLSLRNFFTNVFSLWQQLARLFFISEKKNLKMRSFSTSQFHQHKQTMRELLTLLLAKNIEQFLFIKSWRTFSRRVRFLTNCISCTLRLTELTYRKQVNNYQNNAQSVYTLLVCYCCCWKSTILSKLYDYY